MKRDIVAIDAHVHPWSEETLGSMGGGRQLVQHANSLLMDKRMSRRTP